MHIQQLTIDASIIEKVRDLYGYALSLTQNRDDAEDLLQETLIKAVLASDKLQLVSSTRSWLRRVMRNSYLDVLRRKNIESQHLASFPCIADDLVAYDRIGYDDVYLVQEVRICVRNAIEQLSSDHFEVVVLHYEEGLTVKEIAGVIKVAPGTVQSRLARARIQLRDTLQPLLLSVE